MHQVKFRICHKSLVWYRSGIVGHRYHTKAVAGYFCPRTSTHAPVCGRGRAFRRRAREVKAFIYRHFGCFDAGKGIGIPLRYYCTAVSRQKIEPRIRSNRVNLHHGHTLKNQPKPFDSGKGNKQSLRSARSTTLCTFGNV